MHVDVIPNGNKDSRPIKFNVREGKSAGAHEQNKTKENKTLYFFGDLNCVQLRNTKQSTKNIKEFTIFMCL